MFTYRIQLGCHIILGDFNKHVDDPFDSEANIFNDTMAAFGLIQHVTGSTHQHGNTPDLMFSETTDAIKIGKVDTGAMLMDHKMVYGSLSIRKSKPTREKITIRKFATITGEVLLDGYDGHLSFNGDDLDSLIDKFDQELTRVVDTLALSKEVTLCSHPRQPWFDTYVKSQHKVV